MPADRKSFWWLAVAGVVLAAFGALGVSSGADKGPPHSIAELVALSQAEDPGVRNSAIVALGQTGGPEAESALVAALNDVEWCNRWRAAEGLGRIGGISSVPSLVGQLSTEVATEETLRQGDDQIQLYGYVTWPEFLQRQMAMAVREILKRHESPESRACRETLMRTTQDPEESSRVRTQVALLLAELGEQQMIPLMIHTLTTESSGALRAYAAEVLGSLGAEAAVPALRQALDDPYVTPDKGIPLVRNAAARSLEKLEHAQQDASPSTS